MKIIIFFIFLIFLGTITTSFAVDDNLLIEGNEFPELYDTEKYNVSVIATENSRFFELSIYGKIGKIASQEVVIPAGRTYANFFIEFNPPLYKIDTKYTMEIKGDGFIGRKILDMQDQSGSQSWLDQRDAKNSPTLINFETSNEIQPSVNISNFNSNEKLNIFGNVEYFDNGFLFLTVQIIDPKNNITNLSPIVMDKNGNFQVQYGLSGKLWDTSGKYVIQLSHKFNDEFSNREITTVSKNIQVTQIINEIIPNSENNSNMPSTNMIPQKLPQVTPPQVTPPQVEPNFDVPPAAAIIIFILILGFFEILRRRNNKKKIIVTSPTSTISNPLIQSVTSASTTRPIGRPPLRTTTRTTTRKPSKNNPRIIANSNKIQSWRNCATWPLNTSFSNALQNASVCFSNKKNFSTGTQVNNRAGTILSYSGAFAIVFKFKITNKLYALKCFTSNPHGFDNQVRISRYLKSKKLDFTITYSTDIEIIVQTNDGNSLSCPMLVTPWIDGVTLLTYLSNNNLKQISSIAKNFLSMILKMEQSKIAHGDLQSKNIMIQKDLTLKLIDYDGMFIPELRNQSSQESGTIHFQHPLRLDNTIKIYDETMDRFSSIVIYLSLLVLSIKPILYKKFHDDENIIFRQKDFEFPDKSLLFKEISRISNSDVRKLNSELIKYCKLKQFNKIKTIDEILSIN